MTSRRIRPAMVAGGLALSLGVLAACGGGDDDATEAGSAGFPEATSLDEVCAAGAEEGVVNVRKTTEDEAFAQEIVPFQEKYPDIEVQFVSQRPEDVIQQVVTTSQAGRGTDTDVVDLALDEAKPLFDRDLVANVEWTNLGIPEENTVDIDDIQLYRSQREIWGLVYNTTLTSPDDLPDTWAELTDPKYKGQIVIDPRASSTGYLAVAWGEDETRSWYEDLLANEPLVVEGETAGLLKVGAGEGVMATNSYDATVREQQANGVPVDIKYLDDVVGAKDHYAVIISETPHPNAAMCFLGWYGSEEGMAAQLEFEFKDNIAKPDFVPEAADFAIVDTFEDMELVAKVTQELSAMTVGG